MSFDIKSLVGIRWLDETDMEDSLEQIASSIKEISSALEMQAKTEQHRDALPAPTHASTI